MQSSTSPIPAGLPDNLSRRHTYFSDDKGRNGGGAFHQCRDHHGSGFTHFRPFSYGFLIVVNHSSCSRSGWSGVQLSIVRFWNTRDPCGHIAPDCGLDLEHPAPHCTNRACSPPTSRLDLHSKCPRYDHETSPCTLAICLCTYACRGCPCFPPSILTS